jgi:hypothetical protein
MVLTVHLKDSGWLIRLKTHSTIHCLQETQLTSIETDKLKGKGCKMVYK